MTFAVHREALHDEIVERDLAFDDDQAPIPRCAQVSKPLASSSIIIVSSAWPPPTKNGLLADLGQRAPISAWNRITTMTKRFEKNFLK